MRWLLRILFFWAIAAPLLYLYALPWLLTKLDAKAQARSYAACLAHLTAEHLIGGPGWVIRQADGEKYCHCVSDDLHFTAADLPEVMQHKTPARLSAVMKPAVEACNNALQQSINATIESAPEPRVERKADGTEVLHF